MAEDSTGAFGRAASRSPTVVAPRLRCRLPRVFLRDPVHGLITFRGQADHVVSRLLDTPEVQRLRRIRALGPASLAYPGGEHSRFSHAVGSAYVMRRYLERVDELSDEIPAGDRIDQATAGVALAAALLHDLGHGPFSHTFEGLFPHLPTHESWTTRLVSDPGTRVHRVMRGLDSEMPQRVAELLAGQSPIPHLARAVSGTFDVDRCDYLMRDAYMTGVRYGSVDLDWLLQSLRLYLPPGARAARLAVDGAKGLTAVESFFLTRIYMYRQVYLHKAVRAAELAIRSLFRRLHRIGPPPGTPPGIVKLLRGDPLDTTGYLALDDHALDATLVACETASDPVLSDLGGRVRHRRLFKTFALRPDADSPKAAERLHGILRARGLDPDSYGIVDRVQVKAYEEDEALVVLRGTQVERLLDASFVLHGLSTEQFVLHRAVFPPEVADEVRTVLAEFSWTDPTTD